MIEVTGSEKTIRISSLLFYRRSRTGISASRLRYVYTTFQDALLQKTEPFRFSNIL